MTIAEKIQKLAIAMEVELDWTPEECNEYETFEEARTEFVCEQLESQEFSIFYS
jgi:tRNA(Ile)-lysidine synthase TilS/MesJ